jgi:hypothetical protein
MSSRKIIWRDLFNFLEEKMAKGTKYTRSVVKGAELFMER